MNRGLFGTQKALLLRTSMRYGPITALRQGMSIGLATFIRQKHMLFHLDAAGILSQPDEHTEGFAFSEVPDWHALPPTERQRLEGSERNVDWGDREWFDRGWRLRAAFKNGERIAALRWWRTAAQSRDFLCQMSDVAELLWQATVLPEYRGKRLQVALIKTSMQHRARQGVSAFFINCRNYNTSSHRNIISMGFRPIGYCLISKRTGSRRWHSKTVETAAAVR
jgi:GNAT superfamily N-acetyltransferase